MPWWLAYIEELNNAAGELDESLSDLDVHYELARRRWDLLDPNEFDATVDRIREMDAALAEMNQTTSEITHRQQETYQQALDDLTVAGPDLARDGLAETIRYRAAGLREIHHLDPDDNPPGPARGVPRCGS